MQQEYQKIKKIDKIASLPKQGPGLPGSFCAKIKSISVNTFLLRPGCWLGQTIGIIKTNSVCSVLHKQNHILRKPTCKTNLVINKKVISKTHNIRAVVWSAQIIRLVKLMHIPYRHYTRRRVYCSKMFKLATMIIDYREGNTGRRPPSSISFPVIDDHRGQLYV